MTKCIVIGTPLSEKPKTIQFIDVLNIEGRGTKPGKKPSEWKHLELIYKNNGVSSSYSRDLIFAYDDNRTHGVLYRGWWNDGIVE